MRILFVEDHLELIDDLLAIMLNEQPEWKVEFATDIPSALDQLTTHAFDMVIIDVMLPSYDAIPQRSEGIYLAAWILGKKCVIPGKPISVRAGNAPKVVFYTSRPVSGVRAEAEKMGLNRNAHITSSGRATNAANVFIVIGRLAGDGFDHYEAVLKYTKQETGSE